MQALAGIDAALSRAVEAKEVPGVVALAATDTGILYEGAFGLRDVVDGPAMTRDSVFRIASMTKAVTSVAAMQLVQQVKLPLGQPLDAYFSAHIFAPLGMTDTGFVPSADQASRLVRVHRRGPDGSLDPITMEISHREFFSGGGGLLSTGRDYLAFLRMLLHQGRFNWAELLRPETVTQMGQNQIGNLQLGIMKTAMPELSNNVALFLCVRCGHGLGSCVNAQQGPNGRSTGSLTWAGLFTSYYWIDPQKHVTGVILTQILPFPDDRAVKLYGGFERGVYDALKS